MMARILKSNLRFSRGFSSALYITGDKAQSNFVVLQPIINFNELIERKDDLVKSIEARKLGYDFDKLEKRWDFFKMMDDHKFVLETTKSEIYKMINALKAENTETNLSEIEKLQLHLKLVSDDLKNVKEYFYGIDEDVNLSILNLPNFLHEKTPISSEKEIHTFLTKPTNVTKSHMEIAKAEQLIEYTNPIFYFLKSKASLFELTITNFFQQELQKLKFTFFSNADFARAVIVEGCGLNYLHNNKVFTLKTSSNELNRLHLVGGGSLYAFMSYFAKNLIQHSFLPMKLFTIGRKYTPVIESTDLLNLSQNTVAQVFVGTEDDTIKMNELFEQILQEIIKLYEVLGYHFRVVYVKADDLEKSESLKVSFEMFSNFHQKYVQVGYLSIYDSYLSKRLLFNYIDKKEQKLVNVIAGEVLNVQRFLACAIENNYFDKKSLLCKTLQKCL